MKASRIVCIGGGSGLSALLSGLRGSGHAPTAIVSTFDDGGSSGALRRRHGLPAVGDLRQCLSALAVDRAAADRFEERLTPGSDGVRHATGNLVLAERALQGGIAAAVRESAAALSVVGEVLPVSEQAAVISARRPGGERIVGEASIGTGAGSVEAVALTPAPAAYPAAAQAILAADLVVLGPGSLATSVLPNLLVADIAQALHATAALRVWVANLTTQAGETDGLDLAGHMRLLFEHVGPVVDVALADAAGLLPGDPAGLGVRLERAAVEDPSRPGRHAPRALARSLVALMAGPVPAPVCA